MESIKDKIIGTWKLVSWTYVNEAGETVDYFGKDVSGILMYDQSGYMNAQLMKANRSPFKSSSINGSSVSEASQAFQSYLAYYGKYHEERPGEIIHSVEGSLFPNWIGDRQVRYGKIDGDLLILNTAPTPANGREIVFYVTWKKIGT